MVQGGVANTFNPSTWEAEAEVVDLCEFKASLVYRLSSRTARAITQQNSVLKKPKQTNWGDGSSSGDLFPSADLSCCNFISIK